MILKVIHAVRLFGLAWETNRSPAQVGMNPQHSDLIEGGIFSVLCLIALYNYDQLQL